MGRAGSTSLMNVLEEFDEIALPSKKFDCKGSELLHPIDTRRHKTEMSKLVGKQIKTNLELIECSFEYNRESTYVGFKLLPNAFKKCKRFLKRDDITFIVLTRDDILSLIASFFYVIKI